MSKKLMLVVFGIFFFSLVAFIPQVSYCQTAVPNSTATSTLESTPAAPQTSGLNLFLIGGIIAVVVVAVGVGGFFVVKRRVNEKSLEKFSSTDFQDWVIGRFNGKRSDPSLGVDGFTEGGQPLLIKQSDHVSLGEVEDFVRLLASGKAQRGTIVAFNFDNDTFEGRVTAMDSGIELQLLRVTELLNKRFSARLKNLASLQVTFEAPVTYATKDQAQVVKVESLEKMPDCPQTKDAEKPRVFVSNSNTKVADQVKKMLQFLSYDFVMGDKEETTVPISNSKFGLMKDCDCAIINIAAAEQERRYSGLYILNSNVTSEINAAYLNYNTQVVLLVERKVELPPNLSGLKRIEYDSDDLSFNAAMDLEKVLAGFKRKWRFGSA